MLPHFSFGGFLKGECEIGTFAMITNIYTCVVVVLGILLSCSSISGNKCSSATCKLERYAYRIDPRVWNLLVINPRETKTYDKHKIVWLPCVVEWFFFYFQATNFWKREDRILGPSRISRKVFVAHPIYSSAILVVNISFTEILFCWRKILKKMKRTFGNKFGNIKCFFGIQVS